MRKFIFISAFYLLANNAFCFSFYGKVYYGMYVCNGSFCVLNEENALDGKFKLRNLSKENQLTIRCFGSDYDTKVKLRDIRSIVNLCAPSKCVNGRKIVLNEVEVDPFKDVVLSITVKNGKKIVGYFSGSDFFEFKHCIDVYRNKKMVFFGLGNDRRLLRIDISDHMPSRR